ncbi:MAG: GDP-L-fucose synthase, partial [Alphaproteobacteria bacterium]|nr:GDP-L-fucose synthase [Alphaproteobacteria bacterium]
MDNDSRVLVAGANGMVGSAIVRNLESKGYTDVIKGTRQTVDFTDQEATDTFFRLKKPDYVFVAAAKVGGIMANNTYKADFLTQNLRIQTNIIDSAYRWGVKKLLFLGSSCIYPKFATQPITEDQLMTGALEPTNDAYAIAKIAGIMLCQAYRQQHGFNAISLMPTNLYGPNDNFDFETSHVLPAMIAKFHDAVTNHSEHWEVKLWGDGSAMREFLHVDDLAEACYTCMQNYNEVEHINVGTGEDVTIKQLAETIADVVGYDRDINWDTTKPNGTPRKVLNVDKIKSLGWEPKIGLREGIELTYQ